MEHQRPKKTWQTPTANTDASALQNVAGGQNTWDGLTTYNGHKIRSVANVQYGKTNQGGESVHGWIYTTGGHSYAAGYDL